MSCHLQRNLADIPELPNDLELLELWTLFLSLTYVINQLSYPVGFTYRVCLVCVSLPLPFLLLP